MKTFKILLCGFAVFLIFSSPYLPVERHASAITARYARADSDEIYFCESDDLATARFIIPYTYCVEIISDKGDWYYVKYAEDAEPYQELRGYCLKEHLTPVAEPPENIYLYLPVQLPFQPSNSVESLPTLGARDVTVAYYGSFKTGAITCHYVGYKGDFGYTDIEIEDYPLNEIPKPAQPASSKRKLDAKWISFLVILTVAAAAVITLYFTGKKRRFTT